MVPSKDTMLAPGAAGKASALAGGQGDAVQLGIEVVGVGGSSAWGRQRGEELLSLLCTGRLRDLLQLGCKSRLGLLPLVYWSRLRDLLLLLRLDRLRPRYDSHFWRVLRRGSLLGWNLLLRRESLALSRGQQSSPLLYLHWRWVCHLHQPLVR